MKELYLDIFKTRWAWRVFIITSSLLSAVFGLISPFFQKNFIDQLTHPGVASSMAILQAFPLTAVQSIALAFICLLSAQALNQLTNFVSQRESYLMQQKLAKDLYQKTLSLRVDTLSQKPIGEIVSLYATDIPGATVILDQTIPAGCSTLFPLLLAPVAIALLFDFPIWPVFLATGIITLVNFLMAYRQSRFFFLFKQLAAERIGMVSEWIQNIRTLRILQWIETFEEKIFEKREVETVNRIRMVTNGQLMNAVASSVTFALNLLVIWVALNMTDRKLLGSDLLALLWILGVFLVRPFRQMPWFFTFAFDSWTSTKRLAAFMAIQPEENLSTEILKIPTATAEDRPVEAAPAVNLALDVENMNLVINRRKILNDVSFQVKEGEFVAIVGEVSSGKTMLLLTLLKETKATFGKYFLMGRSAKNLNVDDIRRQYSYVPQEGFIMNASLRENVAFIYGQNNEMDSAIEESLRASQFDLSEERVEHGLDTGIGERGVNLSGGQKQRVSLARVYYHKAPILLLDDCLSAVDVDTEQKLLNELILGAWKDRTRVLVTHRLSVLENVNRIIFLKNGHVEDQGTLVELLLRNAAFREFTASMNKEKTPEAPNE